MAAVKFFGAGLLCVDLEGLIPLLMLNAIFFFYLCSPPLLGKLLQPLPFPELLTPAFVALVSICSGFQPFVIAPKSV